MNFTEDVLLKDVPPEKALADGVRCWTEFLTKVLPRNFLRAARMP